MSELIQLAQKLIQFPSVTPEDYGCIKFIDTYLQDLNFDCEIMTFADITNLWASFGDLQKTDKPLFVFAGHTDVVPAGQLNLWRFDPFSATVEDGWLYGRGACDMKGAVAAMMIALQRFLSKHDAGQLKANIGFLITGDEEADAINGTVKVVETLQKRGIHIDYCLIGEPSSQHQLGDMIKVGRRGSLHGKLTIKGVQGHVAYPDLVKNPIHIISEIIAQLSQTHWDKGNEFFPATSMQVSNIHSGTGALNIVPHEAYCQFNFRYSTENTAESLHEKVVQVINQVLLNCETKSQYMYDYQLVWMPSGLPFLTAQGKLLQAITLSIGGVLGQKPELSTSGGTSDGRFIAPTGSEVIEFGLLNKTIHKVDEAISIDDLEKLALSYEKILEKILL